MSMAEGPEGGGSEDRPRPHHNDRAGERARILGKVRDAITKRRREPHPGHFGGWRDQSPEDPVEQFIRLFKAAGGEVCRFDLRESASEWVRNFIGDYATVSLGTIARREAQHGARAVRIEHTDPADAEVGVSMAYGAVAETGSLIMIPQDGRRAQLLPPVHVVWVEERTVFPMLIDAMAALAKELPSAVGLHSGPSKSADIGQILVKGVHGPGRLIAVLVDDKGVQW